MEPRSRPKITDVARVAGVAPMTVSRVLTGSANVKEETAERVRKAVEMLRYQPNEAARSLRAHRTRTIGIIVPRLLDIFSASCADAIDQVAKRHGYSVIFSTSNDEREIEYSRAQMMLQRGVEGMIVVPVQGSRSKLVRANLEHMHVVSIGQPLEDSSFDAVLPQDRHGARNAVDHLVGHGLKEIVFVSAPTDGVYSQQQRLQGYREAMEAANLRSEVFQQCESAALIAAFLTKKLAGRRKNPLGLFISGELATRNALQAIFTASIKVPEDVALICFDDFPLAEVIPLGITIVHRPLEELGKLAAEMLFEQIERNEAQHDGAVIVLPVELILRRSCGCG